MIDFEKIKFRASSWGNLLAESKTKGEPVGKTCAAELVKIYAQEVYGRKKDIVTKQMEKGIRCEPASIALYSMLEGELFIKNEEELENEWFRGRPDIFLGEDIRNAKQLDDIKTRWDLETFLSNVGQEPDKSVICQLNVYYSLTNAPHGHVVNTLVSATSDMVEEEKYYLLRRMNVATELAPEYLKASEELEKNMVFEDINPMERCCKILVPRDEELIQKMKDKVPILRQWLADFERKHMAIYPKS